MEIITNTARLFVDRNMVKLLETIDNAVVKMKVDENIFAENDIVMIDAEDIKIGTVADSGEGWVELNITRAQNGTSATKHVGDGDTGSNVLALTGSVTPAELLSKNFDSTILCAGAMVSCPAEAVFGYRIGSDIIIYIPTGWGQPSMVLPWIDKKIAAATHKILCWTHRPVVFSGVFYR